MGTIVVTSSNALRRNARCAGRPLEDLPHGQHLALHRTRAVAYGRCGGAVTQGEGGGPLAPPGWRTLKAWRASRRLWCVGCVSLPLAPETS